MYYVKSQAAFLRLIKAFYATNLLKLGQTLFV